jgi:hypothetical protein
MQRLIQWLVGLQSDSVWAGAAAILDARRDAPELRRAARAQRRKQIASLLSKANPALGRERTERTSVAGLGVQGESAIRRIARTSAASRSLSPIDVAASLALRPPTLTEIRT